MCNCADHTFERAEIARLKHERVELNRELTATQLAVRKLTLTIRSMRGVVEARKRQQVQETTTV